MRCRVWLALSATGITFASVGATPAGDCLFIPDKSVCGVPLSAKEDDFIKALGPPDGTIKMREGGEGLLYGPQLLLMFWHGALWQVHSWDPNPNIDFWSFVGSYPKQRGPRLVFPGWSPWELTRQQFAEHDKEFPVEDADQAAENRAAGKASMTVYYDPCYSAHTQCGGPADNWKSFLVNRIGINFHVPKAPK